MAPIQEALPMTTSQTSFLSEIEKGEPIPLGKLAYLRERTRNILYDFIIRKFMEAQRNGLSQADLARRIGKRPEVINRLLGSPGNWRIDTISDLLVGIDAEELEPHSVSLLNRAPRNRVFPEWLLDVQAPASLDKRFDAPPVLGRGPQRKNDNLNKPSVPAPAQSLLT